MEKTILKKMINPAINQDIEDPTLNWITRGHIENNGTESGDDKE